MRNLGGVVEAAGPLGSLKACEISSEERRGGGCIRPDVARRAARLPSRQHREPRFLGGGVDHAGHSFIFLRRPADRRRRAEADRGFPRYRPVGGGLGCFAGLARHRARRHPHGADRRSDRDAAGCNLRSRDDGAGPGGFGHRADLGAGAGQRRADRSLRQQRAFPATRDLCQPVVRPAARDGGRPDLVRAVYRGRGLADGLRARNGRLRLASDDGRVRRRDRGGDRAVGAPVAPAPAAGPDGRLGRPSAPPCPGPPAATKSGSGAALRGVVPVLRADGDARGASRGVLQRSRHTRQHGGRRCSRCCSAVPLSAGCSGGG